MQPRTIAQLDPHYAHEMGFQENETISEVHTLAAKLGGISDKIGEPVTEEAFPILTHVKECLVLQTKEALLDAKLLEPYDSFVTSEGETVDSRFLVVDARSFLEPVDDPEPPIQIRAYFLLLGASTYDRAEVMPFYIVSKREIPKGDTYVAQDTHIFYNRFMADLPINAPVIPHRIHTIDPYITLQGELELAISYFADLMPPQ